MKRLTFTSDYRHPRDPLTSVRYLGGRSYTVTEDVEQAARAAGAIKEKASGSRRRAKTSGAAAPRG